MTNEEIKDLAMQASIDHHYCDFDMDYEAVANALTDGSELPESVMVWEKYESLPELEVRELACDFADWLVDLMMKARDE